MPWPISAESAPVGFRKLGSSVRVYLRSARARTILPYLVLTVVVCVVAATVVSSPPQFIAVLGLALLAAGAIGYWVSRPTGTLHERIADLERLLQERHEEASRTQAILSSVSEGVLMEDQHSQIVLMNPAAHDLMEALSEQFKTPKPVREIETASDRRRFRIGDRVMSVEASPVQTPDGKQLGKVLVWRDVTRETEVDSLRNELIAQISNELQTPLTSIKGYSDLLLKATGGERHRAFLESISRQADTLEGMITDLLDLMQLEAGGLRLRFQPMSMQTVLQQVAENWSRRFEEKGVRFAARVDGPIPQMFGDEARLCRALANLVENVFDSALEGGQATLSLSADDHSVTVMAQDAGVDVSGEDKAQLIARFQRLSLERAVDVSDVGIDMYVAKAIVEAHGGQIRVESPLGKDPCFIITLPLDAGVRSPEPTDASSVDLADLLR